MRNAMMLAALAAAVALSACTPTTEPKPQTRGPAVVFDSEVGARLFSQCSRAGPYRGTLDWTPSWDEIAAFEAALPQALAAAPQGKPALLGLAGYHRQYVGHSRGSRRLIYGNFLPNDAYGDLDWRVEPLIVCDGGPRYFGAEFDVESGRLTHLAFNGLL